MKHTQRSVKLNKVNFMVRSIVSDLNNNNVNGAISNSIGLLTTEQFGYLARVHNVITDKELSAFIHYIVNYQLSNN